MKNHLLTFLFIAGFSTPLFFQIEPNFKELMQGQFVYCDRPEAALIIQGKKSTEIYANEDGSRVKISAKIK